MAWMAHTSNMEKKYKNLIGKFVFITRFPSGKLAEGNAKF
jgi:hypothetical protein